MARARPFLEGLRDINELRISTFPHDAEALSIRYHELFNDRDFDNKFFQQHISPDFQFFTDQTLRAYFADFPTTGPYNLEQLMASRKWFADNHPNYHMRVAQINTFVDDKMLVADVCLTCEVVGLNGGALWEAVQVLRWQKSKGRWLCVKATMTRYAMGF